VEEHDPSELHVSGEASSLFEDVVDAAVASDSSLEGGASSPPCSVEVEVSSLASSTISSAFAET